MRKKTHYMSFFIFILFFKGEKKGEKENISQTNQKMGSVCYYYYYYYYYYYFNLLICIFEIKILTNNGNTKHL
jgi:hypothetical protein